MNPRAAGREARRRADRAVAAAVAALAVMLWVAACGSGGSPQAGASSTPTSASAVGYSHCMREHGLSKFPDPPSSGALPKAGPQELGVSASRYQAAQRACAGLIPISGSTGEQQQEMRCATTGACPQAVVQHWMSGLRTLAGCLRTHGVPRWPDPVVTSLAGHPPAPHFPYDEAGIDHHSPQILAKVDRCVSLTGFQGLPLP